MASGMRRCCLERKDVDNLVGFASGRECKCRHSLFHGVRLVPQLFVRFPVAKVATNFEPRTTLFSTVVCSNRWLAGLAPPFPPAAGLQFGPTRVGCNRSASRCRQTKNSSPQMNVTSCFEFKSGRQDSNLSDDVSNEPLWRYSPGKTHFR